MHRDPQVSFDNFICFDLYRDMRDTCDLLAVNKIIMLYLIKLFFWMVLQSSKIIQYERVYRSKHWAYDDEYS